MIVANYLGDLRKEVVFVGGSVLPLLVDPDFARPTEDIDCIMSARNKRDYYTFSDRLRSHGFRENMKANVLCRWEVGEENVQVDVMPIAEDVLGFTNVWYEEAWSNSQSYNLPNGATIRIVTAVYFLATKFEAYQGRGQADPGVSHDLEDIITVISRRSDLQGLLGPASSGVKQYVKNRLKSLLLTLPNLEDILAWHVPYHGTPSVADVIAMLTRLTE